MRNLLGTLVIALALATAAFADGSYAVFSEMSPESKPLKAGWNRRMFTDTEARLGEDIQYDAQTGLITLAPGTYLLTGFSMVAYNTGGEPREMVTIRTPAAGGYSRLRIFDPNTPEVVPGLRGIENSDPRVICVGSGCSANVTPSLVETIFKTDKPVQILLEHQNGSDPQGIFLRVFTENSKWHVFARLTIRKL